MMTFSLWDGLPMVAFYSANIRQIFCQLIKDFSYVWEKKNLSKNQNEK